jgi:hypothetical protein
VINIGTVQEYVPPAVNPLAEIIIPVHGVFASTGTPKELTGINRASDMPFIAGIMIE